MESEQVVIREIERALRELSLSEEGRLEILKQLLSLLPTPVSPSFKNTLLCPSEDLDPLLVKLHSLIHTEQEYVRKLELLKHEFILPLQTGEVKIKFNLNSSIFGSIDAMINIHKNYITKIKKAYDKFPEHNIESALIESIQGFTLYETYVKEYSVLLDRFRQERAFSVTFSQFIDAKEKVGGHSLENLLALPLNRIPHFCSFIESLRSLIPDTESTPCLFRKTEDLKETINRCFSISNSMEPLLAIEKKLCHTPENFTLCDHQRVLVKKGTLKMVTNKEKKQHFLYLFNDCLLLTVALPKQKYRFISLFSLQYSSIALSEGVKIDLTDGHSKTIHFLASGKNERTEWEEILQKQITDLQEQEVFGRTLQDLLTRQPSTLNIPDILIDFIVYIEKYCTELSGIFRISGSARDITKTKDLMNRGVKIDLETLDDHVVTGLLKQFFREMEETIIPCARYTDLLDCEHASNVSEALQRFLLTIPAENYCVLKRLMKMLNIIAAKEDINKMNAHNLAIVFGLNLTREFATEEETPFTEISFGGRPLFEDMITNYSKIFCSFLKADLKSKNDRLQKTKSLIGLRRSIIMTSNPPITLPKTPHPPPNMKIRKEKKKTRKSSKGHSKKQTERSSNKTKQKEVRTRPRRTLLLAPEQLLCFCCTETIGKTSYAIFIDPEKRCHENCFVCSQCDVTLEFGNFIRKHKQLFCNDCQME